MSRPKDISHCEWKISHVLAIWQSMKHEAKLSLSTAVALSDLET